MIVYKITSPNGKMYIGCTKKSLNVRRNEHKCQCKHFNYPLQQDMLSYGFDNFKFEIIEKCSSVQKMQDAERRWIKELNTLENGYNISPGGNGSGIERSNEYKIKQSKIKKEWAKTKGFDYFSDKSKKMWGDPLIRSKFSASAKKRSSPEIMRKRQALAVASRIARKPGILVKDLCGSEVGKFSHAAQCAKVLGISINSVLLCVKNKRKHRKYVFEYFNKDILNEHT